MAVVNAQGRGLPVLVCEHASNHVPPAYRDLGLGAADLDRHIAWDIGALGLSQRLAELLDAPVVHATQSRLLLDLNRALDAADSIVVHSEDTAIPGNIDLSDSERRRRQEEIYRPFHAELDALIDKRGASGLGTAVVSIHSFTPSYLGAARPWHVGVIAQNDRSLADLLLTELAGDATICVGDNLPYGPQDGVYHSMERHGEARGLPCAMIEVRNDLIADEGGQRHWAARLHRVLVSALQALHNRNPATC